MVPVTTNDQSLSPPARCFIPYLHLRGEFLLQEQQGLFEISLAVSNRAKKSENHGEKHGKHGTSHGKICRKWWEMVGLDQLNFRKFREKKR